MKDFAAMTEEETQLMHEELLRRAAQGFEQCENWQEAAACWAELGEQQRANELYQRSGDLEQAARMWLASKRYAEALALYEQWEQQLIDGSTVAQVRALLGQAVCHHLGAATHKHSNAQTFSAVAGQQAYRQARLLLASVTQQYVSRIASAWAALGDYGVLLDRYDLIQEGYEIALEGLEKRKEQKEYSRVCNAYLASARVHADYILCQELEKCLAKWDIAEQSVPNKSGILPFPVEKLTLLYALTNHMGNVYCVAISPDGQTLVSGSADRSIKVWNLLTGTEVRTLRGHSDAVWSLAISSDGQTLVSGSADRSIKVWNLLTGTEVRTLRGHSDAVWSLAISPDGQTLVSGSTDRLVKVWNLSTGTEVHTLRGHAKGIKGIAISPDGQTAISGSYDHAIKVWNLLTGTEVRTLTGHARAVWDIAISPDGQILASGGEDHTIKIWGI